jgi:ferritin
MMDKKTIKILDESIVQELLVSDIYSLFEKTFREDSEFWYKLSQEELSHSITLQAERDSFSEEGLMPVELVQIDLETLQKQNSLLSDFFEELKKSAPSREEAFSIACALERTMLETIYASCLAKHPETRALKIFQSISSDEKEHIERILQYASNIGIKIDKSKKHYPFDA